MQPMLKMICVLFLSMALAHPVLDRQDHQLTVLKAMQEEQGGQRGTVMETKMSDACRTCVSCIMLVAHAR